MLSDPAGVSSDHRLWRSPTVAFQIFDPVGPRICHEAQSLHLRYGLAIALSTLNPCRYLHEPKTRFPVGRLFPLPGRELHPLKAPGLSWRTEIPGKICVNNLSMSGVDQLMDVSYRVQCAAASPVGVLFRLEIGLEYGVEHQNRRHHDRAVTNSGHS